MSRRFAAVAGAATVVTAALAWPSGALGHGLSVRQDIPIPAWLFGWAAAMVLIVSFVALATLWPKPRLQEERWRPLPTGGRLLTSWPVELLCGAIGVFLLGVVVYSGLEGTSNSGENFAPTFVYIVFWLGLVPLSLVFGDVFRAFNPWRAAARAVSWVGSRAAGAPLPAPLAYPERLGRWPAVVGIVAFGYLELAALSGDSPNTVAVATLIYSLVTWIAMALWGIDRWLDRGEAFSVYFSLLSRMSIWARRGDRLGVRRPLAGLPQWQPAAGSVVFVAAMIGIVSFDGFSAGPSFNSMIPDISQFWESLGFSRVRAVEATYGTGLVATILLVLGFYRLGVWGSHQLAPSHSTRRLAETFAHTLVPIAFVYAAAHYVSFLLLQGQAIWPLLSDPLGDGSDLFGTAAATVDYGWLGTSVIWYLQVGFVIAGHVAALVLAHDRAIAIYDDGRVATRSQYYMLAVMVGFTSLALWLLSEASKG